MEKELLNSYENDLDFIFDNFNKHNKELLIDIARLPNKVLGFGPVKIKSINNHYIQREILYNKFRKVKKINLTAAE